MVSLKQHKRRYPTHLHCQRFANLWTSQVSSQLATALASSRSVAVEKSSLSTDPSDCKCILSWLARHAAHEALPACTSCQLGCHRGSESTTKFMRGVESKSHTMKTGHDYQREIFKAQGSAQH